MKSVALIVTEHDDSKSQDDKGSDGSEVSSPAQQDHSNNNNHPFSKGDPSGVRSIAPENSDSVEKENQGEKVTEIEWSLKPEKDDEDGSSSSRSSSNSSRSSSSDDENSGAAADKTKEEKKVKEPSEVVVSVEAEPESSVEDCDVVADLSPAPAIESVQLSVPISEETINVVESTLVLSSGDDPKGFPVSDAHVAQPSNSDSKIPPSHENQVFFLFFWVGPS